MSEGTASVQKMSYEQAAKTLETIASMNKGTAADVVLAVHLPEKSTYLKITIPKKAVAEKLDKISALDEQARAKEISEWVNANMKSAVAKYATDKEKSFKFAVNVAEVVPVKTTPSVGPSTYTPEMALLPEKKVTGPKYGESKSEAGPSPKLETADYVISTKWVKEAKEFKNLNDIIGIYSEGKKAGIGGFFCAYNTFPVTYGTEKESTKYAFFLFMSTSDFIAAIKDIDIPNITAKQKEKVIDFVTDDFFDRIEKTLKKKGIKLTSEIKDGLREIVADMAGYIIKQRSAAHELE
ncbi:hypothetical protein H0O02_03170 [Candidatus Micrarchaeota archaeon]|nr:hypothetical protein [Candidatus Micrarchaeota archaeon]